MSEIFVSVFNPNHENMRELERWKHKVRTKAQELNGGKTDEKLSGKYISIVFHVKFPKSRRNCPAKFSFTHFILSLREFVGPLSLNMISRITYFSFHIFLLWTCLLLKNVIQIICTGVIFHGNLSCT